MHLGPFKLASFEPDDTIVLAAYDGYFLGRPRADTPAVLGQAARRVTRCATASLRSDRRDEFDEMRCARPPVLRASAPLEAAAARPATLQRFTRSLA